jgi:hypothetical protein
MCGIQASVSIHARDVKSWHGTGVRETETLVYPIKLARKYHGGRHLADAFKRRSAERIKRNIPNRHADERQAEKTTPGCAPQHPVNAATTILSQSYHSNDPELSHRTNQHALHELFTSGQLPRQRCGCFWRRRAATN